MILKHFSANVRQSIQNSPVLKFPSEAFYKMVSKLHWVHIKYSERLKIALLIFANFWVEKLIPVLGESEANKPKLFKFKVVHRKYFRKRFWSYLEVKTECCEPLRMSFFSFFANFWVTNLNSFSGKARQCCENLLHKVSFLGAF